MRNINIYVNEAAHNRAKALGLNISQICSDALESAAPAISQEEADKKAWQDAAVKAEAERIKAEKEAADAALKAEKDAMVYAYRNAQTDEERAVIRAEMVKRGWIKNASTDD